MKNCSASLKELTAGYASRTVIRDLSFSFYEGEVTVLIGANGAGKSTVLRTIAGLLPPLSGQVLIGGKDLRKMPLPERAKAMSFVSTERPDTGFFTCFEIAAAGRYPYTGRFGRLRASDKEIVKGALSSVGAETLSDRLFTEISDGQKQKVLLARAIAQETGIMLLDEPTQYLDLKSKLELLSALISHAKEKNVSIILSLHELEIAKQTADRVILVGSDGTITTGRPEEIFLPDVICPAFGLRPENYDAVSGTLRFTEV